MTNSILRIENAVMGSLLDGYCLTVHEKELVYVQSLSYRSLHALMDLLSGTQNPEEGSIFLSGKKTEELTPEVLHDHGIYAVNMGREFSESMTVYENMDLSYRHEKWFHLFSAEKAEKNMRQVMEEYGISVPVEAPVYELSDRDLRAASLLSAILKGSRLIVIEITGEVVSNYDLEELTETVRRLHEEGTSFLILSTRYSRLAEYADRIQILEDGKDMKEWYGLDENLRTVLEDEHSLRTAGEKDEETEKAFTGLLDPMWTGRKSIWEYLKTLKRENPEMFSGYLNLTVPEEGESFSYDTAVIPRDSYSLLFDQLSVEDNLIIAGEKRLTYGKNLPVINERLKERAVQDFRKRTGIVSSDMKELTRFERKMLSIERFLILRPKNIVLEDPYRAVHAQDTERMREYLLCLAGGMKIFYFSRSEVQMHKDCHTVIETEEGRNARVQNFPLF